MPIEPWISDLLIMDFLQRKKEFAIIDFLMCGNGSGFLKTGNQIIWSLLNWNDNDLLTLKKPPF